MAGCETEIDRLFIAVFPSPCAALTVKAKLPAAVGVPLMTPVCAFSARPEGRLPPETDQVSGVPDHSGERSVPTFFYVVKN